MGTESSNWEGRRRSRGGRIVRRLMALGALVVVVLALAAPAALAAYPDPPPNPQVDPNVGAQVDPNVGAQVAGTSTTQTSGGLAFTGGDIAGMVVIGGVLVGTGVVVIRATRRRHPAVP